MEGIKKAMNERNLNEGQWDVGSNGIQVSNNVEKRFEADIYIHIKQPQTSITWNHFVYNFGSSYSDVRLSELSDK